MLIVEYYFPAEVLELENTSLRKVGTFMWNYLQYMFFLYTCMNITVRHSFYFEK